MVTWWSHYGYLTVTLWLLNGYLMVTWWSHYGYLTVTWRLLDGYLMVTCMVTCMVTWFNMTLSYSRSVILGFTSVVPVSHDCTCSDLRLIVLQIIHYSLSSQKMFHKNSHHHIRPILKPMLKWIKLSRNWRKMRLNGSWFVLPFPHGLTALIKAEDISLDGIYIYRILTVGRASGRPISLVMVRNLMKTTHKEKQPNQISKHFRRWLPSDWNDKVEH